MLTVTNDLSSFSLAAGEPFVLEVQLLDSAGRGIDINDEAMFLTFYSSANRAIVRDYVDQPAQYEGTRYSDTTGEFFRWAFDGRFSEGMYRLSGVRVELAQRLKLGRKILSTGVLSVISSAATVPSLDGEVISDFAIRVTIKAAQMLGGSPTFTIQVLAFEGNSTIPVPDPEPDPALPRIATASALHKNAPASNVALLNVPDGAVVTASFPGLTVNSAARTISGTPTVLSGLLTYTTADGRKRDTVLFSPKSAPRTMRLAMNSAGIQYYYENNTFLDYFKHSEWLTRPATADVNDMPLTLGLDGNGIPGAALTFTVRAGKHRIIAPSADFDVQGYVKEGSDWVATLPAGRAIVNFTRINPAAPPTTMAFVRDDEAVLFRAGEIFKPSFKTEAGRYNSWRFMNVYGGNTPEPTHTPVGFLSYQKGPSENGGWPLEVIARLCRETGTGCYLNVHAKTTTADYVANTLPTLQGLIADGIEVICEYSNEAGWNTIFPQFNYLRQQALNAGYATPGSPNFTGDPDFWAGVWWVGRRVAEMAKASRGTGVQWVVGTQTVQAEYLSTILFKGMDTVSGRLDSDITDWIASGYVGGTLTQDPSRPDGPTPNSPQGPIQDQWVTTNNYDAAIDNLLNYAGAGINDSGIQLRSYLQQNKAIADARGWGLRVYEGMHHLNSIPGARNAFADYRPFMFNLAGRPSMAGFVHNLLEICEEEGVKEFTVFDWDSQPTSSEFGVFGVFGRPIYEGLLQWISESVPIAHMNNTAGSSSLPGTQVRGFTTRADAIDASLTALGV